MPETVRDLPSWDVLRSMGTPSALTAEGMAATCWALGLCEEMLGRSWPLRQFRQQGWIPGELVSYASARHGLPRLLAIACQLDRFRHDDSLRKVVAGVRNRTVTDSGWRHLVLELEVARAGVEVGATVQFEPLIFGSPRSADVELRVGDLVVYVETTSLTRADMDKRQEQLERRLSSQLDAICLEHAVAMDAKLLIPASEEASARWVKEIAQSAAFVAHTRSLFSASRGGIRVKITPDGGSTGVGSGLTSFTGALHPRNMWYRVQGVLRDKMRQTVGAEGAWIRMDALDGLFALTDWARAPMGERVAVIADAVRACLIDGEHVNGVILSSGASGHWTCSSDPRLHEEAQSGSAAILRRPVGPGLVRETVIVPLCQRAEAMAALWLKAYDREAAWLDADLAQRGWVLDRMRIEPAPTTASP